MKVLMHKKINRQAERKYEGCMQQTESDRPAGRGDRPTSRVAGRQAVSDLQAQRK
jgi:hypothetical protein